MGNYAHPPYEDTVTQISLQ